MSDKASGIPGDNGKLREEFGNSADIIRMMADDPAVKGEDGSVIPDGGEIEISEESKKVLREADRGTLTLLERFARETWGKPWAGRAAWIAGNTAAAGALGKAALSSFAAWPGLFAAACGTALLGAVAYDASKDYQSYRGMAAARYRGQISRSYSEYIDGIVEDLKAEAGKEPEYWFTPPTPEVHEKSIRKKAEKRKLYASSLYTEENAAERLRQLEDIKMAAEKDKGLGKAMEGLVIERMNASPDQSKEYQTEIDGKSVTPLFSYPYEFRDGMEIGLTIYSTGKVEMYASAPLSSFSNEDEARSAERKAMQEALSEDRIIATRKALYEKREDLYGRVKSRLYNGASLPRAEFERALRTPDGQKLLHSAAHYSKVRAGDAASRTDGIRVTVVSGRYTKPPFGIGATYSLEEFSEKLRQSAENLREGQKRNITYAVDYPGSDGKRHSYTGIMHIESGKPFASFFDEEISRVSALLPEGGMEKEKSAADGREKEPERADKTASPSIEEEGNASPEAAIEKTAENGKEQDGNGHTPEGAEEDKGTEESHLRDIEEDGNTGESAETVERIPEEEALFDSEEVPPEVYEGIVPPDETMESTVDVPFWEPGEEPWENDGDVFSVADGAPGIPESELGGNMAEKREKEPGDERTADDSPSAEEELQDTRKEAPVVDAPEGEDRDAEQAPSDDAASHDDEEHQEQDAAHMDENAPENSGESMEEEPVPEGGNPMEMGGESPEDELVPDSHITAGNTESLDEDADEEIPSEIHDDGKDAEEKPAPDEAMEKDTVVQDEAFQDTGNTESEEKASLDSVENTARDDTAPDDGENPATGSASSEAVPADEEAESNRESLSRINGEYARERDSRTYIDGSGSTVVRMEPEFRDGLPTGALNAILYYGKDGGPWYPAGSRRFEEYRDGLPSSFRIDDSRGWHADVDIASGWFRPLQDDDFRDAFNMGAEHLMSPDGTRIVDISKRDDGRWEARVFEKGKSGRYFPALHAWGDGDTRRKPEDMIQGVSEMIPASEEKRYEAYEDAAMIEEAELQKKLMLREAGEEKPYPGYRLDRDTGSIILTGVITRDKVEAAINAAAADDGSYSRFVLKDTRVITVDAFASADSIAKRNGMLFTSLADLNRKSYGLAGTEFMNISPFANLQHLRNVHFDRKIPDFALKEKGMPTMPLFPGNDGLFVSVGTVDEIPDKAFTDCIVKAFVDNSMAEDHVTDIRYEAFALDDPKLYSTAMRKKDKNGKSTATWQDYQSEKANYAMKAPVTDEDIKEQKALFRAARSISAIESRDLIRDSRILRERFLRHAAAAVLSEYRQSDDFRKEASERIPGLRELWEKEERAGSDEERIRIRKEAENLILSSPEASRIMGEYAASGDAGRAAMETIEGMPGWKALQAAIRKAEGTAASGAVYTEHFERLMEDPLLKEAGRDGRAYVLINNSAMSDVADGAFRGRQIALGSDRTIRDERKRLERLLIDSHKRLRDIAGERLYGMLTGNARDEAGAVIAADTAESLGKASLTLFTAPALRQVMKRAGIASGKMKEIEESYDAVRTIEALIRRIDSGEAPVRAKESYTGHMAFQNTGITAVLQGESQRNRDKDIKDLEKRIEELKAKKAAAEDAKETIKAKKLQREISFAEGRIATYEDKKDYAKIADEAFAGNKSLAYTTVQNLPPGAVQGNARTMRFVSPSTGSVSRKTRNGNKLDLQKKAEALGKLAGDTIKAYREITFLSSLLWIAGGVGFGIIMGLVKTVAALRKIYITRSGELGIRAKADAIAELGKNARVRFDGENIDILPQGGVTRSERAELEALIRTQEAHYRDNPELAALVLREDRAAENALLKQLDESGWKLSKEEKENILSQGEKEDKERSEWSKANGIDMGPEKIEVPKDSGQEKTAEAPVKNRVPAEDNAKKPEKAQSARDTGGIER